MNSGDFQFYQKLLQDESGLWLTQDKAPDRTATAVFGDVWFSSRNIALDGKR